MSMPVWHNGSRLLSTVHISFSAALAAITDLLTALPRELIVQCFMTRLCRRRHDKTESGWVSRTARSSKCPTRVTCG